MVVTTDKDFGVVEESGSEKAIKKGAYPESFHIEDTYARLVWDEYGFNINDREERIFAALQDYDIFCIVYFPHYFHLKPAPFHNELSQVLKDDTQEMVAIIGFRGSAKSTHASMAYPIWQALRGEHNFIILINDTGAQRDINIENIKSEFEDNTLLQLDFPYIKPKNSKTKWTRGELELSNKVYILGRSRGQKIRGIRYRQWRPSLVICDDLEDLEWVRKKENRDKTERWLTSEVIPAIEETKAKLLIIGNLLHTDALMMRLKKRELMKVLEFPLVDPVTKLVTWLAKYPTIEAFNKQKAKVHKVTIWLREYLLKIVPEDGAVVVEEDIVTYNYAEKANDLLGKARNAATAVDLAISEKTTADFTAMVSGVILREEDRDIIYILPNIVHKRVDLYNTIKEVKQLKASMPRGWKCFVEGVAYQLAAVKEMKRKGVAAISVHPISDKRARLETAAVYIKSGMVRFPEHGMADLMTEMLGFGIEDHDDILDALVYLILGLVDKKQASAGMGKGDKI